MRCLMMRMTTCQMTLMVSSIFLISISQHSNDLLTLTLSFFIFIIDAKFDIGDTVWALGYADSDGNRRPLDGKVDGYERSEDVYSVKFRSSADDVPAGPFCEDDLFLTREEAKSSSNISLYKKGICMICGCSNGNMPKGCNCVGCIEDAYQFTYDSEQDRTVYIGLDDEEGNFQGKIIPDAFFVPPNASASFAQMMLPKISEWRDRYVQNSQARKRLRAYRVLRRSMHQAMVKRRLALSSFASGDCSQLSILQILRRDIIDDPNNEHRDATTFLEQQHAVYHTMGVLKKDIIKTSDGRIDLLCSNRLSSSFKDDLGHNPRSSDYVWGTPCPIDALNFQFNHNEYKGSKILLCRISSANDRYRTIGQYFIEDSKGNKCLPNNCIRFCRSAHAIDPCQIFEGTIDGSRDIDNIQWRLIYMYGQEVDISVSDGLFSIDAQGVLSHPLALLESTVDSSVPLEVSSIDVDELDADDDDDDDDELIKSSSIKFANRGQETLLAMSIGCQDIPRFDDPTFAKAENISLPTNTMLIDECVRRNINVSYPILRSTLVDALINPSTITGETHDDETVENLKKHITAWYDEAKGANSTIVSKYRGKHSDDRDQVNLNHDGPLVEPIVYCYEGRVGNERMCCFDTLPGANSEINTRGVKGRWYKDKTLKNLTFRKVPRTDDMEMNVILSAVGDAWIQSHKARGSSYSGVYKENSSNPHGLYTATISVNNVNLYLGRRQYAVPEDAALVYDLVAPHLPFKRRRRVNFPSGEEDWRDARRQADVDDDEGLTFDEITTKATQYVNDYRRSSSSSSTSNRTASSSRSRRSSSSSSTSNQTASSSRSSRRSSSRETSVDDDDSVASIETEVSTVVTRSNAPLRPSKPLKPELIKIREQLETQVDDQYREIKFVSGLVQKLQKEVHALRQQVSLKSLMLARYDRSLTGPITASERERLAQLEADLEAKQQRYDLLHDKAIRTLAQKVSCYRYTQSYSFNPFISHHTICISIDHFLI